MNGKKGRKIIHILFLDIWQPSHCSSLYIHSYTTSMNGSFILDDQDAETVWSKLSEFTLGYFISSLTVLQIITNFNFRYFMGC